MTSSATPAWAATPLRALLELDVPIVQGPFGGGLSSVELAATVSAAGGLGSYGVHHLTPEAIERVAAEIRSRTDRPFALNLWISAADAPEDWLTQDRHDALVATLQPFYDELGVDAPSFPARVAVDVAAQTEAVLRAAPAIYSFVFGVPGADVLAAMRERGITTVGTATTVEEAVALDEAGVDAIVATGFEAGGHRVSWLDGAEASLHGTLALVPQVVDAVGVPVLAAGGIADGRGIAAALALGAHGVQVGTAFLATRESAAGDAHRALLGAPGTRRTVLTRAYTGRLARGIPNRLLDELAAAGAEPAPYPFQGYYLAPLKRAAIEQGRTDLLSLWSGQAAPLVRHRAAADLLRELVRGTTQALGAAAAGAGTGAPLR